MNKTTSIRNFIGGEWTESDASEVNPVFNPSTEAIIAETPLSSSDVVDQAVAVAHEAYKTWSNTPVLKRASILFKYKELLETSFDQIVDLIVEENGKTRSEASGDARRGIEVVDFACGIPHILKGETLPLISSAMDGATSMEPIGVCAGITPFNFPAMVPMWMYPLAIACGNTFVLKPSEKVPLTANYLAKLFQEAGLPEGVFNVVHGGKEVVERLCKHPDVAAISFVGSSHVAQSVYEMGTAHGKRVQAAGGAKNVMVVMPDAEPESTLRAIMGASFGCAGQRCMAGSVLMPLGDKANDVVKRVHDAARSLKVLPTDSCPQSDMGPVIDESACVRLFGAIGEAQEKGAELLCDGRVGLPDKGFFLGPTLFDNVMPDDYLAKTELFGPVLSIQRPQDLEQSIDWLNSSGYGNGAVIFTQNGSAAREFSRKVQCGMVGVNVGVPAPISVFAFSGWNRSFFGDLHIQGMEGVRFYTRQKVVFSRWDNAYVRQQGW